MKVTCLKESLQSGIRILSRIANHNATLPILSSICLSAREGELVLMATNLEIGVVITKRASVEKKGTVAVPAQIIASIIDGINSKKITLEKKAGNVSVTAEGCVAMVNGIDAAEFPLIPTVEGSVFLKEKGSVVSRVIERVLPSMAVSSMRPDLAGVYVVQKEGSVSFVTTDGFRLGECKVSTLTPAKTNLSMIIPGKTAAEIARIFGSEEGAVAMSLGENQLVVRSPGIYLVSRVIDGNFPDYTQIIPSDFKAKISVNKEDLTAAIKLASVFSDATTNDIGFEANPQNQNITISAQSGATGQVSKNLKGVITGEKINTSINHKFLLDGIVSVSGRNVSFLFGNENTPIMLTEGEGVEKQDVSFLYLVSPIKKQ